MPRAQLCERRFIRLTFHLHPVTLRQLETRVSDTRLQATIVGKHDQSLAVKIQQSRRIDVRHIHIIGERRPPGFVGELA